MDPASVIENAIHELWQPIDGVDRFPSRSEQSRHIIAALLGAGFDITSRVKETPFASHVSDTPS